MQKYSLIISANDFPLAVFLPDDNKGIEESSAEKLMHVGTSAPWNSSSCRFTDIGNDTLYHLCETFPLPASLDGIGDDRTEENLFASKMWLIGRAYAASPERYAYKNDKKPKAQGENSGYTSFFHDIAHILFKGTNPLANVATDTSESKELEGIKCAFKSLLHNAHQLQNKEYLLRESRAREDAELLATVDRLVIEFAEILVRARFLRDNAILRKTGSGASLNRENQYVPLSFCSKFLHFHLPKLVFIYDSIAGGKLHYPQPFTLGVDDNWRLTLKDIVKWPSARTETTNCQDDGWKHLKDAREKYVNHTLKELAIAKAVFNAFSGDEILVDSLRQGKWMETQHDPIPRYYSITRMVDALVSNGIRKKDSKTAKKQVDQ